jgi:hypothetical protein
MPENKTCPLCAETIPLSSATCEFCGAQFEVTSTGYCQTCHDVREADGNGQCKVCGNAVVDLHVESKLIEETAQEPLSISPPIAQPESTKTWKSRLPIGILMGILFLAAISILLFLRKAIPSLSRDVDDNTKTPIATNPIDAPKLMTTITPDRRETNPANNHHYLFVGDSMKWHEARDYCTSLGGYLVTVGTNDENQYINHLVVISKIGHDDQSKVNDIWLGATDEVESGKWVWVTGEPWQYTNWAGGEPNNYSGVENFLQLSIPYPIWNDVSDGKRHFVCEWDK